jgi:hypothetical protein
MCPVLQSLGRVGVNANTAIPSPRAFLTKSYPTMKKHNPSIPIMLREAQGTSPKVYARYEFGQEKSQSLEGTTIPTLTPPPHPKDHATPSRLASRRERPGDACAARVGEPRG